MNLYYAISDWLTSEFRDCEGAIIEQEDYKVGGYFFAESRGKAKALLAKGACDFTEIASVKLIAKNVDHAAGYCDIDNPLHPDYGWEA